MEELATLLFWVFGLSSYPLVFFLSLKKSVSLTSRGNASGGRVLFSLVTVYFETALLSFLIAYFFPSDWPPYAASLVVLSAITLTAGYILKATFDLSFRKGILAYFLWQALSLALGGLLVVTIFAAMLETIFTFILIVALMLVAWWMWSGRLRIGIEGKGGHGIISLKPDEKVIALAIIVLLCSSLFIPSAIRFVHCDPQPNSTEYDVDVDFNWNNKTVSGNIAWNITKTNTTGQDTTGTPGQNGTGSTGQLNPIIEFGLGAGDAGVDFVRGFWTPGVLQNLHDAWRDREYLDLITDITRLQSLDQELPPLIPVSGGKIPDGDWKEKQRDYVKDGALADQLEDMTKKEFKVEIAESPYVISKTFDVDRYVDNTAWTSATADLLTLNSITASETFHKVEAETHDWFKAFYEAGKVFGLSAPALECVEAVRSGDARRIGRALASAGMSYGMLALVLKSAWNVYQGEGLVSAIGSAAYDFTLRPLTALYGISKAGFSKLYGALSEIRDVGLRTYLEGAMADLKTRLTGYEYISFLSSDEEIFSGVMPEEVLSNVPGIIVVPPKNTFNWARVLKDASVAKKISSESWVNYFINAIKDYKKLEQIGEGETEILGLKINMQKDIQKTGNPDSLGLTYYNLELMDTGSTIRVYEDNTISVLDGDKFIGLKTDSSIIKTSQGGYLTTILMREHLETIGFYDEFTIGQETERAFGVKGIVKDKGVSTDGPYVAIEYKVDTEKGSVVKVVRINAEGATVNGRSIVDVETSEDGAVYLYYKQGNGIWRALIKLPDTAVTILDQARLIEAEYLTTRFDYNDIQGKTGATDLLGELDIESPNEYTRKVAYAVDGKTTGDFRAKYGIDKWEEFTNFADDFSISAAEEALRNMGLDIEEVKGMRGVRPSEHGEDISIKTKDGNKLILEIKYAGKDSYPQQKSLLAKYFREGKADIGIIFWEGEYHVFINSATKYEPLVNIANIIERAGSRSIKDFAGIAVIGGLGLLSGYFSDAKGEAMSVTDDSGRWIGEFHDSYLDHTNVDGSEIFDSWLALTSVENSYLQNVRSSGTTIAGSTLTNCNVSVKMIYDSIVQNTLAVCSTIANCVIDLCRILNSTLVNVMGLKGSHIEDTTIANSADISNCTVIGSNLNSVVNLVNTSVTGSNLTLVVNVDNTKIDRSDISYSANISRSDITNTKLVGCTVQGSRLTSCTAVDSNLVNVNATSSKLTKAIVENSNLKGVELKNTNVIGTDLANVVLVDKTVTYGRSVDVGETGALRNLTASKIGTPNYSGKGKSSSTSKTSSVKRSSSTSSSSKTQAVASDETGALRSLLVKSTSSTSSVVQTSSQQVQRAIEVVPSGIMPAEARRLLR